MGTKVSSSKYFVPEAGLQSSQGPLRFHINNAKTTIYMSILLTTYNVSSKMWSTIYMRTHYFTYSDQSKVLFVQCLMFIGHPATTCERARANNNSKTDDEGTTNKRGLLQLVVQTKNAKKNNARQDNKPIWCTKAGLLSIDKPTSSPTASHYP